MKEYYDKLIKIDGSTSNRFLPRKRKIRLRLSLEDRSKGLILNLQNFYYLLSSLYNLVSLELLNNNRILDDNENKTLYQLKSKKVLAQTKKQRNSYLLKPLNLSDKAIFLVKINNKMYEWPPQTFFSSLTSQIPLFITIWHNRFDYTNFTSLKKYLNRLKVDYVDNSESYICNSCQYAKKTKIYNWDPQKRSTQPYHFIHIDLVGLINSLGLLGKKYFFTFTKDCTRYTETYTGSKKSNWLKYFKTFHNLYHTISKQAHPIKQL